MSYDPSTIATLRRALAPEGDSVLYQDRSIHVAAWAKRSSTSWPVNTS